MRRILVPTDFSDNAKDALEYALAFTNNDDVHIFIIHVIDPSGSPKGYPNFNSEILEIEMQEANDNITALQRFCDQYCTSQTHRKLEITSLNCIGPVAIKIKEKAHELNVDLIIMGTQGENHGIYDRWFGTVSSNVIKDGLLPVVLIPKSFKFEALDKILLASNQNKPNQSLIDMTLDLLNSKPSSITFCYICKDSEYSKDFDKLKIDPEINFERFCIEKKRSGIAKLLCDYTTKNHADLLVLSGTKKNFGERILEENLAEEMKNSSSIPILIFNTI